MRHTDRRLPLHSIKCMQSGQLAKTQKISHMIATTSRTYCRSQTSHLRHEVARSVCTVDISRGKRGTHADCSLSPSPILQISTPPSPPMPIIPGAQSTLSILRPPFRPSQTLKLVTALFSLRKSHRRTMPSYAPVTSWCSDADVPSGGVAMQEGVAGWGREAIDGVVVDDSAARKSYWDTVRSVDAARTLCPDVVRAISRKGFAEAVYEKDEDLAESQRWKIY